LLAEPKPTRLGPNGGYDWIQRVEKVQKHPSTKLLTAVVMHQQVVTWENEISTILSAITASSQTYLPPHQWLFYFLTYPNPDELRNQDPLHISLPPLKPE